MKEKLTSIYTTITKEIEGISSIEGLEELKLKYLSRKGELNTIKKGLKDLSDEDKRVVGAYANEISQKLDALVDNKYKSLYKLELDKKLKSEKIDITLDGKFLPKGKVHPLTATTNEIVSIFQSLGFSLVTDSNSPEVETEYYNFDMLNFPKDHPAKDMQDTFYTELAANTILRSQTSNAQIRAMEGQNPPIRVISPGRVYRNETVNARKNNFFHQIEGYILIKI